MTEKKKIFLCEDIILQNGSVVLSDGCSGSL